MKKFLLAFLLIFLFNVPKASADSGPVQVGFIVYCDFQGNTGGIYVPKENNIEITKDNIQKGSKVTLICDGKKVLTIDTVTENELIIIQGKPGEYDIIVE
jgi:hypothetical protein